MTLARDSAMSNLRGALVGSPRDALRDCCCRPCRGTLRVVTDGIDVFVSRQGDEFNQHAIQKRSGADGALVWEYSPIVTWSGSPARLGFLGLTMHGGQLYGMHSWGVAQNAGYLCALTTAGAQLWLERWFAILGDVFNALSVGVVQRTAGDQVLVLGSLRTGSVFTARGVVHDLASGARITERSWGGTEVTQVIAGNDEDWTSLINSQSSQYPVHHERLGFGTFNPLEMGLVWRKGPVSGVVNVHDMVALGGTLYLACSRVLISGVQAFVAALDQITGATLWVGPIRTDRSYRAIDTDGTRLYVAGFGDAVADQRPMAWGLTIASGADLWQFAVPPRIVGDVPMGRDIAAHAAGVFLASDCSNAFGRSLWRLAPATGAVVWSV